MASIQFTFTRKYIIELIVNVGQGKVSLIPLPFVLKTFWLLLNDNQTIVLTFSWPTFKHAHLKTSQFNTKCAAAVAWVQFYIILKFTVI